MPLYLYRWRHIKCVSPCEGPHFWVCNTGAVCLQRDGCLSRARSRRHERMCLLLVHIRNTFHMREEKGKEEELSSCGIYKLLGECKLTLEPHLPVSLHFLVVYFPMCQPRSRCLVTENWPLHKGFRGKAHWIRPNAGFFVVAGFLRQEAWCVWQCVSVPPDCCHADTTRTSRTIARHLFCSWSNSWVMYIVVQWLSWLWLTEWQRHLSQFIQFCLP